MTSRSIRILLFGVAWSIVSSYLARALSSDSLTQASRQYATFVLLAFLGFTCFVLGEALWARVHGQGPSSLHGRRLWPWGTTGLVLGSLVGLLFGRGNVPEPLTGVIAFGAFFGLWLGLAVGLAVNRRATPQ